MLDVVVKQGWFGLGAAGLAVALCASCHTPPPNVGPSSPTELVIESNRLDELQSDPELASKLAKDPFTYFRFVSAPFSRAVCARFEDRLSTMPEVNLHGDAHVEQYAVTSEGQGLSDYDHASAGPAVIDLIRFGASALVACRINGWSCEKAGVIDAFLAGYRDALVRPDIERREPSCVARMRRDFSLDRKEFLRRVSAMMRPIPQQRRGEFDRGMRAYVELMLEEHGDLGESYFELVRAGLVRVGVGSRLDRKFLIRIQGPSEAPDDDVVLESKELQMPTSGSCVHSGAAFRVLLGKTRIEGTRDPLMAVVPRSDGEAPDDAPFWVHTWAVGFVELDVHRTLLRVEDLAEVARDVGIQLGRGHVVGIADPFGRQLRKAQLRVLREAEGDIRDAMRDFSDGTWRGWERFRQTR